MTTPGDDELRRERAYVDAAYDRVTAMREAARGLAGSARRLGEIRSAQALFERDSAIAHAGHRLAALEIAKDRLIVGRLDLADGTCLYVGRLAVADEAGDPLVVDWRAPAAEPFYRALPHDPMGVVRRRHFRWRHGELLALEDEVFDLTAAGAAGLDLVGEGALMAALDAPRTGRMQDVVATIQAEQDVVIRRPREGVTVVQGAPGTGKTAVALHRAAYLLYAERARLAGAVLFVGPSATFLRYVEDVVPSLGEDRVVLATPSDLGPEVVVGKVDTPAAAAVKGDLRMVDVLARAIRAHQRAPKGGIVLAAGRFRLAVDEDDLKAIVATARRHSTTHNRGRVLVERLLLQRLETAYRAALERDHRVGRISEEGVEYAPRLLDVVDRKGLTQVLHAMWPLLTPDALLQRVLRSPQRLARAGRDILTDDEVAALDASPDAVAAWSEADVALLDEAEVLLGPIPVRPQRSGRRRRPALDHVAERIIEERLPDCPRCGRPLEYLPGDASGSDRLDCRECKATFATTALMGDPAANELHGIYEELTHQFATGEATALRPADARYGHVVVDEAQDLSPMQWRAVARRSSGQSFTLAGDEAQAVRTGAAATWDRILDSLGVDAAAATRHELTVNYRTPAEVMEIAGRLLAHFAPHLHPASSVRTAGVEPRRIHTGGRAVSNADVADALAAIHADVGSGLVAVIAPEGRLAAATGNGDGDDDRLTAVDAKGLEFDGVVVVDPEAIAGESPGTTGMARLYVALTRATTRLTILAPAPPAPPLDDALGRFESREGRPSRA